MASAFKGLTQSQINKRIKEGRGQGSGADYQPFIYVHEISPQGRVHRLFGFKTKRILHLLSDLELAIFLILDWSPDVIDIREQFPMNVDDTIRIAHEAGLPHWKYSGVNQVLTTDFVVSSTNPEMKLFAIQAKPAEELEKAGTIERLELERRYLEYKEIPWDIITKEDIPQTILQNIQWLYPAQEDKLKNQELQHYFELFRREFQKLPDAGAISIAQRLDMSYDLENGTALYWLRCLLAKRFFAFDMEIPYRKLLVSDLHENAHDEPEEIHASA
ncbi:TnsA endonuclease C-terminal domain-containing protein [Alteromonas sp. a30]|uniref:TnsA endonuclease C-terminal domain-containing protein n=1 Tax=Alteromonas sp. a30 TaxID=2730917 RepID=UPI00227EF99C|nr:TnsA endonuclease C-terminal domain-containing protein [Alteromonas sp. a30]MCY7294976.1 heteromeric transposase endonuclease subunit TnsA [Alteromonas sp. a30]